jgi:hypothetical protein
MPSFRTSAAPSPRKETSLIFNLSGRIGRNLTEQDVFNFYLSQKEKKRQAVFGSLALAFPDANFPILILTGLPVIHEAPILSGLPGMFFDVFFIERNIGIAGTRLL